MPPKGRTPPKDRPHTEQVNFKALEAAWLELVRLKSPGFCWSGRDYARPSRAQSPDEASLVVHARPLKGIIAVCKTGWPAHASLRFCLAELDKKFTPWAW